MSSERRQREIRDADGVVWHEVAHGILASAADLAEYEFMEKRLRPVERSQPKPPSKTAAGTAATSGTR